MELFLRLVDGKPMDVITPRKLFSLFSALGSADSPPGLCLDMTERGPALIPYLPHSGKIKKSLFLL
jgi:hypothetical protein